MDNSGREWAASTAKTLFRRGGKTHERRGLSRRCQQRSACRAMFSKIGTVGQVFRRSAAPKILPVACPGVIRRRRDNFTTKAHRKPVAMRETGRTIYL